MTALPTMITVEVDGDGNPAIRCLACKRMVPTGRPGPVLDLAEIVDAATGHVATCPTRQQPVPADGRADLTRWTVCAGPRALHGTTPRNEYRVSAKARAMTVILGVDTILSDDLLDAHWAGRA